MNDLHWPEVDEEVLQKLPSVTVLRAIVKALGFGRAIAFLREYGGIPFNLPVIKNSKMGLMPDEIARLRITLKPYMDIKHRIALPKADKLLAHIRNQEIINHRESESLITQALKYNLTTRQVINLRNPRSRFDTQESRIKRNFELDQAEVDAMMELAYKAAAENGGKIYKKIINKLERAAIRVHHHHDKAAQFDLF